MKPTPKRRTIFWLLAGAITAPAAAEQLPLWELGAGAAAISFPDYRGSNERTNYLLPLPYFVYRGEFLKADRQRVRGLFFKSNRAELDVSISGSVPVKSDNNRARRGMPDLDPTLEIGPNLTVMLLRSDTTHLNLRLPARAAIATDLTYARDVGWVFQPQINVDFYDRFPGPGWNLGFAAGPLFGNKRYHNYYYGVAPEFATAERPAYDAGGGYAGLQGIAALSKRFPSYWVGGFVRLDTLAGATFDASPLVRQNESFAAGIAIAWIIGKSPKRVEAEE